MKIQLVTAFWMAENDCCNLQIVRSMMADATGGGQAGSPNSRNLPLDLQDDDILEEIQ